MSTQWGIPVTKPGQFDPNELIPAGLYPAAVVAVIDVGMHPDGQRDDGSTYDRRSLVLVYEALVAKQDGSRSPRLLAEKITASASTSSTLYGRHASLVGPLEEGQVLNPAALLGRPCCIAIIHNMKGDRTYANLDDVTPMMHGMPPHQPQRPLVCWSMSQGTPPPDTSWAPKIFRDTIQSLIESSAEAKEGKFPLAATGRPPQQAYQQSQQPAPQQYQQPAPAGYVPQPQQQYQPPQQYQQPAPQQHQQPVPAGYAPQPPQQYHQPAPQQYPQQGYPQQQAAPATAVAPLPPREPGSDDEIPF